MFLMFIWMKWFWKTTTVIMVTIIQSVFILDDRYTQTLGVILMLVQMIAFYLSEYNNRTEFINQQQKQRDLKQLVEIMKTKLPIGVAIFQKNHINQYEQQAQKFAQKKKDSIVYQQSILPLSIQKNHHYSQQEIKNLKNNSDKYISCSNIRDQKSSVLIQQFPNQETKLDIDIRFINDILFQQAFNITDQQQQQYSNNFCSKGLDDSQIKMKKSNSSSNSNSSSGQKSQNINIDNNLSKIREKEYSSGMNHSRFSNKYNVSNDNVLEMKNLYTNNNNITEANNLLLTECYEKQKRYNNFRIKDKITQQSVHQFLESLYVPQRQNNPKKQYNSKMQNQDDEDQIGFYTNFAEVRRQQQDNRSSSGQKINFKQLINNFFQANEESPTRSQRLNNFDRMYFNCQQILDRPRKETKADLAARSNNNDDNLKQYDIKITSVILNGEPALIVMINDSTDRFIMQQMKESSEFKSQLLNYIQHIAKTPLNSIIQLSETMEQWFPLSPNNKQICNDIKDNLEIIKKNGLILHHQVQSIIDLQQINCNSKIQIKTDLIDLYTVIREVQELFQTEIEGKHLKFEIDLEEENIEMQTDENRLTQILIEMIGNSVKFTKENDSIKIQASIQKTYTVSLICITIIDTGSGMSPEQVAIINSSASLENIPVPNSHFRQGPGIGLEVSRKLIGLLGPFSKFNLKSAVGEGCQFKFWLYMNLNEKEAAEKSNRMMRKTSDLILEKDDIPSYDKFVISNKLQHMEIMIDPFSIIPQVMYSNKDFNHFIQSRRSSKQSGASFSPKQARTTVGGVLGYSSSFSNNNQLTQLQNQFLLEQQTLQAQIMKKRSLYRMNYSPQIVIRKRDMTLNTYMQEQQKNPLAIYIKPKTSQAKLTPSNSQKDLNNEQTEEDKIIKENQSENAKKDDNSLSSPKKLEEFNQNNNKCTPVASKNLNSQFKKNISNFNQAPQNQNHSKATTAMRKLKSNVSLDSLDTLLRPFRHFNKKHTLQMRSKQESSKFQRSNRKFLSNSYQASQEYHSTTLSPCIKKSTLTNQSQQVVNSQVLNETKNYSTYFTQALDNNNYNKIRSESQFKKNPQNFKKTQYHRNQSIEDPFTQLLRKQDHLYKSTKLKDLSGEESENDELDEENEVDDTVNSQIDGNANQNSIISQNLKNSKKLLSLSKGFLSPRSNKEGQSGTESHNLVQTTRYSIDKKHLQSPLSENLNTEISFLQLELTDEFGGYQQEKNDVRNLNIKSNEKVFVNRNQKKNAGTLKYENQQQQFTFNTIKNSNFSQISLRNLDSCIQIQEDRLSIVSLQSNNSHKFSRPQEKSHYHSLTHIPDSATNQSPRMKKRHEQKSSLKKHKRQSHSPIEALPTQQNDNQLRLPVGKKCILNTTSFADKEKNNIQSGAKHAIATQGVSFLLPDQNEYGKMNQKEPRIVNIQIEKTQISKNEGESTFREYIEDKLTPGKNRKSLQQSNRGSIDGQKFNFIYSLDNLVPLTEKVQSPNSKEQINEGNQNQNNTQIRTKILIKKDTANDPQLLNIQINALDNTEQIYSSQVLDDQKSQNKMFLNTYQQNIHQQQRQQQFTANQVVKSHSSIGNKQVKPTMNTIMSHDIDQDIFDTLFPEDTLILIVDDTTFNRIVLKQMFKSSQNIVIQEAINGQDAIDKIKTLKETQNRTFNLIFMDLNMPIMDGFEALKQIQNLIHQKYISWVPVVAVTAYDTEVENCRNKGFDGFISKPVRIKEMVRSLIRIISIIEASQEQQ
ncbi:response regulator receiver domain protein, partial (macronuclear) [Tetrahymena thermophila SB210]